MSTQDPSQQVGPRPALLLAVSTQQHLLSELFSTLQATSSAPNADALPALHAALVQSSERLDALSAELKLHQAAHAEMLEKHKAAKDLEDEIIAVIRELHTAKIEMEDVVSEGAKVRESIEKSEAGKSRSQMPSLHRQTMPPDHTWLEGRLLIWQSKRSQMLTFRSCERGPAHRPCACACEDNKCASVVSACAC